MTKEPTYVYRCEILNIHDGDTIKVMVPMRRVPKTAALAKQLPIDHGFHMHEEVVAWLDGQVWVTLHVPLRFLGLNAPELATPDGKASLAYLESLVKVGDVVTIHSAKSTDQINADKYGDRWDAVIMRLDGLVVNDAMVASGHAKAWDGQGTKPT